MKTTADFLRLLEAAYRVQQPREAWFAGLLASAAFLDRGAGLGLLLYDVSGGTDLRLDALDGFNLSADWKEAGSRMHADLRLVPGIIKAYESAQCATFAEFGTELGRDASKAARVAKADYYEAHQLHDSLFINGLDCSGKGCSLQVFSRVPVSLSAAERELYSLLAVHLTSAYRLQRRSEMAASDGSSGAEAILTSAGRIEHAEGPATTRAALSELSVAVVARERARKERALDPLRVLARRKALVMARWTLLDEYERDGHRFVLARVNAPEARTFPALSIRERQVANLAALGRSNKLIAYELGLAHSTVRVLVLRACAKLGVRSRAALVALVRDGSQ